MPDLTLDFTWYKDAKGYRLIPAKEMKLKKGQTLLQVKSGDIVPARVVRNGGDLKSYRPLENFPHLFEYFVKMPRSEEGVLEFIEKFGPLTGLNGKGDVVPLVIDQAERMQEVIRGGVVAMVLNKLNVHIVTDDHGLRLKVWPATLLDAMWLQLVQAGRTAFRQCEQCGSDFVIGPGKRRADAKFCSDECRINFNSLKRSRP